MAHGVVTGMGTGGMPAAYELRVEVSAIDPMESMKALENPALGGVATQVQSRLKRVIESR